MYTKSLNDEDVEKQEEYFMCDRDDYLGINYLELDLYKIINLYIFRHYTWGPDPIWCEAVDHDGRWSCSN